jgi:hypothetical protein
MERQQARSIRSSSSNGEKKKGNDKQEEELQGELDVFAALDASLQHQQVYEEQVIREATHQLAPSLTGIGFPDLSSLMMMTTTTTTNSGVTSNHRTASSSASVAASAATAGDSNNHNNNGQKRAKTSSARSSNNFDLPPIHTVLTQVRKNQQEEPHQEIHFLKEQMLLHFMSTVAGVARQDLPEKNHHDRTTDTIRKRQRQASSTSADSNIAKQQEQQQPSAATAPAASIHSRVSIMKHKRKQQQQVDRDVHDDMDEIAQETTEHRAQLKELRRQRQQRRHERRNVLYGINNNNSHNPHHHDNNIDEDDEMEFMDHDSDVGTSKADDDSPEEEPDPSPPSPAPAPAVAVAAAVATTEEDMSIRNDVSNDKTEASVARIDDVSREVPDPVSSHNIGIDNAARSQDNDNSVIECPLCQEPVACLDLSQMDAVLAAHMAQCQQEGNHDGTSRRRRSSRRAVAQKAIRYCEDDDEEEGQEVGDSNQEEDNDNDESSIVARSRRSSRNKLVKNSNEKPRQDNIIAPLLSGVVANSSALTNNNMVIAIDDMNYEHYEDRVDDWIQNGPASMKVMKELDTSVALPGAADLGHGLVVPAWINDRLFGYQREGLAWLWDLHLQQAGGMLGDEMGLVRRCQKYLCTCLVLVPLWKFLILPHRFFV